MAGSTEIGINRSRRNMASIPRRVLASMEMVDPPIEDPAIPVECQPTQPKSNPVDRAVPRRTEEQYSPDAEAFAPRATTRPDRRRVR